MGHAEDMQFRTGSVRDRRTSTIRGVFSKLSGKKQVQAAIALEMRAAKLQCLTRHVGGPLITTCRSQRAGISCVKGFTCFGQSLSGERSRVW